MAEVTVSNTGDRGVRETVQVYVRDLVTSVSWADTELKAYRQVDLAPGETARVSLRLPVVECTIVDSAGDRHVEPGEFELLVGSSSSERDLLAAGFVVREQNPQARPEKTPAIPVPTADAGVFGERGAFN